MSVTLPIKDPTCSICSREIPQNENFNVLVDPLGFPYKIVCKDCKK
jgi:hypothetical protein